MKSNRVIALFTITFMVLLFWALFFFLKKNPQDTKTQSPEASFSEITIGNSKLYVEKASNEIEWSRGLSGRTELKNNRGMVFIFPILETKNFWMKDTLIPLDIIWVAKNRVVGLDRMLTELNAPLPLLKRYISPFPVDKVIETNLDWTVKNGIKINDKISY